jgi:ribosome-binding protein aMBF1 (putative translation factor)
MKSLNKNGLNSSISRYVMEQDWETVILTKPVKVVQATPKKKDPTDDIVVPPEITFSLQKAIQQARLAQKWSQKDLAQKLNVPVSTINQYENGTAVPNNLFIATMEKLMNTMLPRIKKNKEAKES